MIVIDHKKNQLWAKYNGALTLLGISPFEMRGRKGILWQVLQVEANDVDVAIRSLGLFNMAAVGSKVDSFYNMCMDIKGAVVEVEKEEKRIGMAKRDFENLIYEKRPLWDEDVLQSFEATIRYEFNKSTQAVNDNFHEIAYKHRHDWKGIFYKTANDLKQLVGQKVAEAEQILAQRKRENTVLEKEKAQIAARETANANIEKIRQDYDKKRKEEIKKIEQEFEKKVAQKVKETLEKERPKMQKELEGELLSKQHHFIEEEVSKRLRREIEATLKRKEEMTKEEKELDKIKFSKEVSKLELKYKKLIEELKLRNEFLDKHLKETIFNYEKTFKEQYQNEIEKRAKELAKDYLKKEFPFE